MRSNWRGRRSQLRRWARHTPNTRIALNLIAAGAALAVIAVVVGIVAL